MSLGYKTCSFLSLGTVDVVEPWGSSHGELSRSPHSPGDAVATPQVVSGKCPSEKVKDGIQRIFRYLSPRDPRTLESSVAGTMGRCHLIHLHSIPLATIIHDGKKSQ
ncbi:jg27961 [Pararge aegeria aegeria]|uniref:Jg27961 protein n=1 Tax=Pararge aegeria aegeria TaxID=348720 RepID=A0A8S4S6K3_9NEOP|nr:jg27961 [Pararge aegeria aegeria]